MSDPTAPKRPGYINHTAEPTPEIHDEGVITAESKALEVHLKEDATKEEVIPTSSGRKSLKRNDKAVVE